MIRITAPEGMWTNRGPPKLVAESLDAGVPRDAEVTTSFHLGLSGRKEYPRLCVDRSHRG